MEHKSGSEGAEQRKSKLTPELVEQLGKLASPSEALEVVIEISQGGDDPVVEGLTRRQVAALLKEQFVARCAPVDERITEVGGEPLEAGWLNGTRFANLPGSGVEYVAESDFVERVDLPERLTIPDEQ